MKRRVALVALGAGLAAPYALFAQQPKLRRVGVLATRSRSTPANPDANYDAFVLGLRELGYVEGKNLIIDWRFADGAIDRLPGLATELVRSKPEVILTHGTPGTLAAQRVAGTIPIVFAATGDPVKSGFAANLARPAGNLTGLSLMSGDLAPKHIELMRSVLPKVKHVAYLWNPDNPAAAVKDFQAAAAQVKLKVLPVQARTAEEIAAGFAEIARAHAGAAFVSAEGVFIFHRRLIVEAAAKHRIPTIHYFREDVQAGALISYGQNTRDHYRRAASYVDKILKGAKPADLPIEQPTKIHLAINRKTAKALGIAIPQELLLRADEVIE